MRFLVTGGAGFIGSNLVGALVKRGDTVVVLDDFSTGKHENLAAVADQITLIEGSLTDLDTVRRATEGADYVLHLECEAPCHVPCCIGNCECVEVSYSECLYDEETCGPGHYGGAPQDVPDCTPDLCCPPYPDPLLCNSDNTIDNSDNPLIANPPTPQNRQERTLVRCQLPACLTLDRI